MPNVETIVKGKFTSLNGFSRLGYESSGESELLVEYHTPKGKLTETVKLMPGVFQWKYMRSWQDIDPWISKRRIKEPKDYEIAKFMVEDTEFKLDDFPIQQAKEWLGDDGIVCVHLPHSAMQTLLVDWVGIPKFYKDYLKNKEKVLDLYYALDEKYVELYKIVTLSDADFINMLENVDGTIINPKMFEDYYIPSYNKCHNILNKGGKIFGSHFDGKLNNLKHLIKKCPQDVIEAFHPPPIGDIKLDEALEIWKDKVVMVSIPSNIYELGEEELLSYINSLLEEVKHNKNIIIEISSENLVSNQNLRAITEALYKFNL
jgi:hypothetical protein